MNGMSEDGLIKAIQKKTNNFMAITANKGLDYSFGSGLSPFEDKNLNSFISGLLGSLGYDTSTINVPDAPGWNEPVPAIWFAEPARN